MRRIEIEQDLLERILIFIYVILHFTPTPLKPGIHKHIHSRSQIIHVVPIKYNHLSNVLCSVYPIGISTHIKYHYILLLITVHYNTIQFKTTKLKNQLLLS